jgi:WD40 repeat protein
MTCDRRQQIRLHSGDRYCARWSIVGFCFLCFSFGTHVATAAPLARAEGSDEPPALAMVSVGSCVLPDQPSIKDHKDIVRVGMSPPHPLVGPVEATFDYAVTGFDLSPSDPRAARVVTVGLPDWQPRIWRASDGEPLGYLDMPDIGEDRMSPHITAFSSDGKLVALGASKGKVTIFDTTMWHPITVLTTKDRLTQIVFNPSGRFVATAHIDAGIEIWNAATGERIDSVPTVDLQGFAFSGDGRRLIIGEYGRTTDGSFLFSLSSAGQLSRLGFLPGGIDVALNADGSRAVTRQPGQPAQIWDVNRQTPIASLKGSEHCGTSIPIAFSPNGTRIVSANCEPQGADPSRPVATVWDATTGMPLVELAGGRYPISQLAFTPDGRSVVSGSAVSGMIRTWDTESGRLISLLEGSRNWIRYASISSDGTRVVTVPVGASAFNAVGMNRLDLAKFCCGGTESPRAILWDSTSSLAIGPITSQDDTIEGGPAFSPNDTLVAMGLKGGARIWRARDGRYVSDVSVPEPSLAIRHLAFSADGHRLGMVDDQRTYVLDLLEQRVQDGATTGLSASIGVSRIWWNDGLHPGPAVGFNRDGTIVFSGRGFSGLDSGPQRPATWFGPEYRESAGSFLTAYETSLGLRVVTGGYEMLPDGYPVGHVWDGNTGQSVAILRAPPLQRAQQDPVPLPAWGGAISAAFRSDGRKIVTLSNNGPVVVWAEDQAWKPTVQRELPPHVKIGAIGWMRNGTPIAVTCDAIHRNSDDR